MNYAEYGLDATKKSKDDDTKPADWLCLWCAGKVNNGFTLCFSNWVICYNCVAEAKHPYIENETRWLDQVDCLKCNKKPVRGYRSHESFSVGMYICEACIDWGCDLARGNISSVEFKNNIMATLQKSEAALRILRACTVKGNVIHLPAEALARDLNNEVRKHLELIGGKWVGGKTSGFVFKDCEESNVISQMKELIGDATPVESIESLPVPAALAERMAQLCTHNGYLSPKAKILEPIAGEGSLVKAIFDYYPTVTTIDCLDPIGANRLNLLNISGVEVKGGDFLQVIHDENYKTQYRGQYDVVIANTLLGQGNDVAFVRQMYSCCKTNGRIVAIVHGWRTDEQTDFQQWLSDIAAFKEELPDGTFDDPAILIVIDKLEESVPVENAPTEPKVIASPDSGSKLYIPGGGISPTTKPAKKAKEEHKAPVNIKRIVVPAAPLIEVLKKVKEVVTENSKVTILSNILIKVRREDIQVIATDLMVTILATIDVENTGDYGYDYLLPFKFLFDITKVINTDTLTIELLTTEKMEQDKIVSRDEAIITTFSDTWTMSCSDNVQDWPTMPEFHIENSMGLADDIILWLNRAIDTTSDDTARPAMQKILMSITQDGLAIASTDAEVIFEKSFEGHTGRTRELLIDTKIAKALKGFKSPSLSWSETHVAFVSDVYTIIGTIQDEKFPDYKAVFPAKPSNLRLSLEEFKGVMNKVSLTKKPATMYLRKEKGVILIESFDLDFNRNVTIRLSADYTGKCDQVAVNPKKIMTLLGQIDYQTINLAIEAPFHPIIITTESDDNYRALTMPMAVSQ